MENYTNERKYISIIVFSIFIFAFVIGYTIIGKATPDMDALESEKQENEENMSSYAEQASDMMESRSELESLVQGLNSELTVINETIAELESQVAEKNQQIEDTAMELESAKEQESKQYDDMKLRIQFLYEMGQDTYLDVFLSGSSIADMLNKVEYYSELTKYDRNMLNKYKNTKQTIEEKESVYISEQEELLALQEQLEENHRLIVDKIQLTNQQIVMYSSDIAAAEAAALEYEKKIEANRLAIEDESRRIEESSILEAESIAREKESRERASREQASREQASRDNENNGGGEEETTSPQDNNYIDRGYTPAESDLDMLAALIECEAGNQPYYGMLCVGAVVMNRINSPNFPNTLYEVLYQPYQFTPVTVSGRFALVLARGANSTCYQAAREVLEQGVITGDWLFFRINDGSREGEVIGDHVFY